MNDIEMPYTNHKAKKLSEVLDSINSSGLPVEVFDAFLSEYAKSKDLDAALAFAAAAWDI